VSIRAVTFDYWNTLCRADVATTSGRRRSAWHEVAASRFLPHEPAVLDAVLAHIAERHHEGWMANSQYTAEHALEEAFVLLGDLPDADRVALADAWLDASRRANVQLTDGLADVLAALDDCGVRIGIVCDVGLTPSVVLREFLEQHGVLTHFDHWSFSDEVGVYKPAPAIFRHALDGLGVPDPRDALHVGDLRRTDVAGARAAGMTAVRYRGVFDDPQDESVDIDGDHVIDDLTELLTIVGVAVP
jgi:putative hydrolase of the HAD superfamily